MSDDTIATPDATPVAPAPAYAPPNVSTYGVPSQLPVPKADQSLTGDNWARNLLVLGGQMSSANNARFGAGFLQNPGASGISVGLGNAVGQISNLDSQAATTQNTLAEAEGKRMLNAQNNTWFTQYQKGLANQTQGSGSGTAVVPTSLTDDSNAPPAAGAPTPKSTTDTSLPTPTDTTKEYQIPVERRQGMLEKAIVGQGLPAAMIPIAQGMIPTESSWVVNRDNATSGAIGLGQVLPSTAKDPGYGMKGVDPASLKDPQANLNFSMQYLYNRGKALGLTDQDWAKNPGLVMSTLAAYGGAKNTQQAVKYTGTIVGHGLAATGQAPTSSDPHALMQQLMSGQKGGAPTAAPLPQGQGTQPPQTGQSAPPQATAQGQPQGGQAPAQPPQGQQTPEQVVDRLRQQQAGGQTPPPASGTAGLPAPQDQGTGTTPQSQGRQAPDQTPPAPHQGQAPIQGTATGAPPPSAPVTPVSTAPQVAPVSTAPTPHPESIAAQRQGGQTGGAPVTAVASPAQPNPEPVKTNQTGPLGMNANTAAYVQRLTNQSQSLFSQEAQLRQQAQAAAANPMTQRYNPGLPAQLTDQANALHTRAQSAQDEAQKQIGAFQTEQNRRVELRGEGSVAINPASGEVIQTPTKTTWTAKDGTPMQGFVNTLDSHGHPLGGTVGPNNEPAGLIQGTGVPAGQSPGDKAYSEGRGKELAEDRSKIDENASSAQLQNFTFDNMRTASGGWNQGPLAAPLNEARSYIIAAQKAVGMEPSPIMQQQVDNFTEFNKNAGTVVRQVVHDLSSRAAAVEFQNVQSQMVGTGTPEHIVGGIIDQFQALNDLKMAQQQYAQNWDASGKPPSQMQSQMQKDLQPTAFLMNRMSQTADGKVRLQELFDNLSHTKEGQITAAHIGSMYSSAKKGGYFGDGANTPAPQAATPPAAGTTK